ncbi:hypothetical protein ABEB36_007985 [Hypothenemus hampei]|uniref:PIH1D1/2/3 CS-like domain-containing protein n=1 Tax=Hypothenemus hampei TaxID=57062 RepID=A0ABD1EKA5_HYPHA
MTSNIGDIEKLVELFQITNDEQENLSEDGEASECISNQQIENRKSKHRTDCKISPYAKIEPPKGREILDPEEVDDEQLYFETANRESKNWKQTPKWEISYRQSVTASDMFLGMSFKTPATSSCENMVISIHLPGENRQNVDLKIDRQKLRLSSPKYILDLELPHPVDPKRGNAQFDKEFEKLIVTLILDREFAFLNF